jgi:hypothetical protein
MFLLVANEPEPEKIRDLLAKKLECLSLRTLPGGAPCTWRLVLCSFYLQMLY